MGKKRKKHGIFLMREKLITSIMFIPALRIPNVHNPTPPPLPLGP